MPLEIILLSEKKGSNPGGECLIPCLGQNRKFYLKYCPGSKLPRTSSLTPCHQPIYEALTCELAKRIGLHIPESKILCGKEISFKGEANLVARIDPHRRFYFISEMLTPPQEEDPSKTEQAMRREEPYREAILVADIVGKKQNYYFYADDNGGGTLMYLDLGCNFVHAVGGYMFFQHQVLKHLSDPNFKRDKRILKDWYLIPCEETAQELIPLTELTTLDSNRTLPLIDSSTGKKIKVPIGELLSGGEIEEINRILTWGIHSNLSRLKEAGLVVKD